MISWAVVLPIIGALVPLCIPSPQVVVGVIVNALLALYAIRISSRSYTVMSMTPSIGAVGNGIVLGTITPFLIFFLPFIWIGNMMFIYIIRRFAYKGAFVSVGVASVMKAAILFFTAYIFVQLHIVPQQFLFAMGTVQLFTALIGGSIAVIIHINL